MRVVRSESACGLSESVRCGSVNATDYGVKDLARQSITGGSRVRRADVRGSNVALEPTRTLEPSNHRLTCVAVAIIECVPNISEGRRADVVERIVDTVRRVPGARLLDYSSDASHNRSVITL